MAQRMSGHIPVNGRMLEIAPGPGYFCIELANLGDYQISGLDISKSFVEIARRKIDFREGNASAMPFPENTFGFTFCQATFKNFSEPVRAIAEIHRVLRPGGISVISGLRRDASAAEIEREIQGMGIGPFNRFLVRWTFKNMLLKSAYSIEEMRTMVAQTPFGGGCDITLDGVGFQVWLKK
jgi:ubiquinone/menaquinone biosynthesis C-methylase UbiE